MEGFEKFEIKQNVSLQYFGAFITVLYNYWYIVLAYRLLLTSIEIISCICKSLLCFHLHISSDSRCSSRRLNNS